MKIIKPHSRGSHRVENWGQIKEEVAKLKKYIADGKFPGKFGSAFAIHHSQVSEDPYNFFVFHPNLVNKRLFLKDRVIINAEVIDTSDVKKKDLEGCMSFPFRDLALKNRFRAVEVKYEVPGLFGKLKKKQGAWADLIARCFQHEIDHGKGRCIYDK